jgi:hypothetical protein
MTKEELIQLGKQKIRKEKDLMLAYIQLFQNQFGYKPDCAGCTFNSDWNKFIQTSGSIHINNIKFKPMNDTRKYKIKRFYRHEILTYKENGRPRRVYGKDMTDEFAEKYLTTGTLEEIEERKKKFEIIPEDEQEEKKEETKKAAPKKQETKEKPIEKKKETEK